MSEPLLVTVVADPGLPTRRVQAIEDDLREDLESWFDRPVQVELHSRAVLLLPDNSLELDAIAGLASQTEADVTLLVTEIPRHTFGKPLVAELREDLGLAIVSCPTFGVWRSRARLRRLLLACAVRSLPEVEGRDATTLDHRWTGWTEGGHGSSTALHATTITATPRLVMGMTAANEPLKTASRLSSALAAAAATGAFGIFYHSIWQMAAALSTARLAFIAVAAVVVMTAWLVVSNGLWDRARLEKVRKMVGLYNLSTLLTLVFCVVSLYVLLVVLIFLGAVVVIDPDFMGTVLGFDSSIGNYLEIAWLSAAMGVVAGALGSSFDSDTEVRDLTHGQRERQRFHDPDADAAVDDG